jgi:hypothetical protein
MKNPFIREQRQSRTRGKFSRIKSGCVGNVNYDPVEGTLEIAFSNPEIGKWRYYNVPVYEAAGLIESSSRGSYFNQNIRGQYETERVE